MTKLSTVAFWAFLLVGCAMTEKKTDVPRFDGSSDATFDKSYVQVLRPLTGRQPRELALALFDL